MRETRLATALSAEPLPSEGTVLVLGAAGDADLAGMPADRLRVVQGFRPDHDALAARGLRVMPEPEGQDHAAAVVFLPRSRAEGRDRVAQAMARCRPGAPVWIDGQKTDGIDTMLRDLRARLPVPDPLAQAHGKCVRIAADPAALADWQADDLIPAPGFVTRPGVFSAEAVDAGSALLAGALPVEMKGRVVDLGAGWGWLAAQVLARPGVTQLDLIEADHTALACARSNIDDPRAAFHWADATRLTAGEPYQAVVCNPPFHTGRATDPTLGQAFIAAAARILSGSGTLWLVANRQLPYEAALAASFREVEPLAVSGGFKLFRAAQPQSRRPRPAAPAAPQRATSRGRR
ncbi:class I SAM-dependent methyltransferase [Frigidibacter oleivorans]|uniref:class I SAM-dependent methyltransferase n=1 Tax=Frigidibacter oleivorans TaxID=2487129 RepID=UPI000F8DA088|nr:class I SAM-dependent methyltransferase [Frigidibacter oleivorans]